MFFHFQLHPIAEIKPWGRKDEPVLHWFGLSDGLYWIEIGTTELFRYSKTSLANYLLQDPAYARQPDVPYVPYALHAPYIDYFVVRLWEDILAIAPDVIDPLPAPLLQRLETIDKWLYWCRKVERWRFDELDTASNERLATRADMYNEALSWWWDRDLNTGPFMFIPGIRFWSDGQFVHCLWDSRKSLDKNGIPIWDAVYGTTAIPRATFMEAITSFNTRFMAAMADRVQTVLTNWSHPEIKLDFTQLAREQTQRAEHFAKRMAEVPTRAKTVSAWEHILETIQTIEHDPDFLAMQ